MSLNRFVCLGVGITCLIAQGYGAESFSEGSEKYNVIEYEGHQCYTISSIYDTTQISAYITNYFATHNTISDQHSVRETNSSITLPRSCPFSVKFESPAKAITTIISGFLSSPLPSSLPRLCLALQPSSLGISYDDLPSLRDMVDATVQREVSSCLSPSLPPRRRLTRTTSAREITNSKYISQRADTPPDYQPSIQWNGACYQLLRPLVVEFTPNALLSLAIADYLSIKQCLFLKENHRYSSEYVNHYLETRIQDSTSHPYDFVRESLLRVPIPLDMLYPLRNSQKMSDRGPFPAYICSVFSKFTSSLASYKPLSCREKVDRKTSALPPLADISPSSLPTAQVDEIRPLNHGRELLGQFNLDKPEERFLRIKRAILKQGSVLVLLPFSNLYEIFFGKFPTLPFPLSFSFKVVQRHSTAYAAFLIVGWESDRKDERKSQWLLRSPFSYEQGPNSLLRFYMNDPFLHIDYHTYGLISSYSDSSTYLKKEQDSIEGALQSLFFQYILPHQVLVDRDRNSTATFQNNVLTHFTFECTVERNPNFPSKSKHVQQTDPNAPLCIPIFIKLSSRTHNILQHTVQENDKIVTFDSVVEGNEEPYQTVRYKVTIPNPVEASVVSAHIYVTAKDDFTFKFATIFFDIINNDFQQGSMLEEIDWKRDCLTPTKSCMRACSLHIIGKELSELEQYIDVYNSSKDVNKCETIVEEHYIPSFIGVLAWEEEKLRNNGNQPEHARRLNKLQEDILQLVQPPSLLFRPVRVDNINFASLYSLLEYTAFPRLSELTPPILTLPSSKLEEKTNSTPNLIPSFYSMFYRIPNYFPDPLLCSFLARDHPFIYQKNLPFEEPGIKSKDNLLRYFFLCIQEKNSSKGECINHLMSLQCFVRGVNGVLIKTGVFELAALNYSGTEIIDNFMLILKDYTTIVNDSVLPTEGMEDHILNILSLLDSSFNAALTNVPNELLIGLRPLIDYFYEIMINPKIEAKVSKSLGNTKSYLENPELLRTYYISNMTNASLGWRDPSDRQNINPIAPNQPSKALEERYEDVAWLNKHTSFQEMLNSEISRPFLPIEISLACLAVMLDNHLLLSSLYSKNFFFHSACKFLGNSNSLLSHAKFIGSEKVFNYLFSLIGPQFNEMVSTIGKDSKNLDKVKTSLEIEFEDEQEIQMAPSIEEETHRNTNELIKPKQDDFISFAMKNYAMKITVFIKSIQTHFHHYTLTILSIIQAYAGNNNSLSLQFSHWLHDKKKDIGYNLQLLIQDLLEIRISFENFKSVSWAENVSNPTKKRMELETHLTTEMTQKLPSILSSANKEAFLSQTIKENIRTTKLIEQEDTNPMLPFAYCYDMLTSLIKVIQDVEKELYATLWKVEGSLSIAIKAETNSSRPQGFTEMEFKWIAALDKTTVLFAAKAFKQHINVYPLLNGDASNINSLRQIVSQMVGGVAVLFEKIMQRNDINTLYELEFLYPFFVEAGLYPLILSDKFPIEQYFELNDGEQKQKKDRELYYQNNAAEMTILEGNETVKEHNDWEISVQLFKLVFKQALHNSLLESPTPYLYRLVLDILSTNNITLLKNYIFLIGESLETNEKQQHLVQNEGEEQKKKRRRRSAISIVLNILASVLSGTHEISKIPNYIHHLFSACSHEALLVFSEVLFEDYKDPTFKNNHLIDLSSSTMSTLMRVRARYLITLVGRFGDTQIDYFFKTFHHPFTGRRWEPLPAIKYYINYVVIAYVSTLACARKRSIELLIPDNVTYEFFFATNYSDRTSDGSITSALKNNDIARLILAHSPNLLSEESIFKALKDANNFSFYPWLKTEATNVNVPIFLSSSKNKAYTDTITSLMSSPLWNQVVLYHIAISLATHNDIMDIIPTFYEEIYHSLFERIACDLVKGNHAKAFSSLLSPNRPSKDDSHSLEQKPTQSIANKGKMIEEDGLDLEELHRQRNESEDDKKLSLYRNSNTFLDIEYYQQGLFLEDTASEYHFQQEEEEASLLAFILPAPIHHPAKQSNSMPQHLTEKHLKLQTLNNEYIGKTIEEIIARKVSRTRCYTGDQYLSTTYYEKTTKEQDADYIVLSDDNNSILTHAIHSYHFSPTSTESLPMIDIYGKILQYEQSKPKSEGPKHHLKSWRLIITALVERKIHHYTSLITLKKYWTDGISLYLDETHCYDITTNESIKTPNHTVRLLSNLLVHLCSRHFSDLFVMQIMIESWQKHLISIRRGDGFCNLYCTIRKYYLYSHSSVDSQRSITDLNKIEGTNNCRCLYSTTDYLDDGERQVLNLEDYMDDYLYSY